MNKRISAFISAVLMLLLCGCSGQTKQSTAVETSEVVLRFYSTLGESTDEEITGGVLAEYTAENSHITLFCSSVTAEETYKLSLPDSATYRNNAPDIVYAPLYAVSDLLSEEYVSIEEIRTYKLDYASDIEENALLRDSSGKAYGAAVRGEGKVLVVNTDLARDTRDLVGIANEISKTDIYLFADNALDSALFFEYLMTVYTNSEISFDEPQDYWKDGFKLFSDLVRLGAFAPADGDPAEIFSSGKAVFAVLSEGEAAALSGENYQCAAFFGGFTEGLFITRSAFFSPLKRQAVLELADRLLAEKDSYSQGMIPADGSGVFFSLGNAYPMTSGEDRFGVGCWDEVLSALTRGDEPQTVLDMLINKNISESDIEE